MSRSFGSCLGVFHHARRLGPSRGGHDRVRGRLPAEPAQCVEVGRIDAGPRGGRELLREACGGGPRVRARPAEAVARRQQRAERQRLGGPRPVEGVWGGGGGAGAARAPRRISSSGGSVASPLQTATIQRACSSSSGKYGPRAR